MRQNFFDSPDQAGQQPAQQAVSQAVSQASQQPVSQIGTEGRTDRAEDRASRAGKAVRADGTGRTSKQASKTGSFLPKRVRRRIPEIAMGLLLVLFGGVLVYIFASQDDPSREVLALARDVSKGDVLSAAHIAVLEVPADVPVAALSPQAVSQVLGSSAAGDYPSGMLLVAPLLTDSADIPPGMITVGAILEAGQYPIVGFSRGDRVNILARNSQGVYAIVARNVEVREATRLAEGAGASLFVAFLVSEQMQTQVVSAIASGSIRLGLVPSEERVA